MFYNINIYVYKSYIYIYIYMANQVNLEKEIITIRTNKIFKEGILNLNNPGKKLNVYIKSTEQVIFS